MPLNVEENNKNLFISESFRKLIITDNSHNIGLVITQPPINTILISNPGYIASTNLFVSESFRKIIFTNNSNINKVIVTQSVTNIITITSPGPIGPIGPPGTGSIGPFTGSFTGSAFIGNGSNLTGSFSGSFVGALTGTSSWATNASQSTSSSYAGNSILFNGLASSTFATTGSNTFIGTETITGSVNISGSTNITQATGSFSGSFKGPLVGTASWATSTLWGSITGSISAQSDLQIALNSKGNIDGSNWAFGLQALGDIAYASSSNAYNRLAGNTSIWRSRLTQTGSGSISNAPQWVNDTFSVFMTNGDQSTSSTSSQSVTDLITPTLEINTRYRVFGTLIMYCDNSGGVKIAMDVPNGSIFVITLFSRTSSTTAILVQNISSDAVLNATPFLTQTGIANRASVIISGEVSTSSTPGSIQLMFAAATTGQTAFIQQIGSNIIFEKIV